ncbi:MAG: uroporphyrinogen-III synthase [Methylococcales bacterium]|nr:uroporphyrinogen-III synthase [Methylococcaceae bacterium]
MSQVLKGVRVLVTRPAHQAKSLIGLIEQAGGEALAFPTLAIVGLDNDDSVKDTLQRLETYQWVIFISANAVNFALRANGGKIPAIKSVIFSAVGRSTAKALELAGLDVGLLPEQDFNSEGLLAMPQMQQLTGQSILIIRGQGGREELATTLRERGAKVDYLEVYKRDLPEIDAGFTAQQIINHGLDVITITSGEALHNLVVMFGEHAASLRNVLLVVVSDRIRTLASGLGFNRIAVTKSPSDPAILETIIKFVTGNERG